MIGSSAKGKNPFRISQVHKAGSRVPLRTKSKSDDITRVDHSSMPCVPHVELISRRDIK
jgi:hypothetical protein